MKWFKKMWNKHKNLTPYQELYEKDDVTRLFEDLETSFIKKEKIGKYIKELESQEKVLGYYETLKSEEKQRLQSYITQYKNIEEKQKQLKGRLVKNNRSLFKISEYEEEIPRLIKELKIVEKKVKDSERDIFYLQEEQESLKIDRESLLKGYKFLKIVSGLFLVVMTIAILSVFGIMQWLREDIWLLITGLGCIGILILVALLYSKQKIEKKLYDNELLQQKAAKIINKCKIRYFHNNRYLQFEFEKLGIDSVAKLEMLYNRYMKNKNNEKEYNEYTRMLMTIEEAVYQLFNQQGLYIDDLAMIEEWLANSLKVVSRQRQEERKILHDQVKGLEKYEEELLREIFALSKDKQYQLLVEEKMQEYMTLTKTSLDKKAQYA